MTRSVSLDKAVEAFGGTITSLAQRLDMPMTTVHGWRHRGRISRSGVREIERLAKYARKDVWIGTDPDEPKPKRKSRAKHYKKRKL